MQQMDIDLDENSSGGEALTEPESSMDEPKAEEVRILDD